MIPTFLLTCLFALTACSPEASPSAGSGDPGPPSTGPGVTTGPIAERDSVGKIDAAEATGSLDHDTALLYKVYAALDYASLPTEFQSTSRVPAEATSVLGELGSRLAELSPAIRSKLDPFFLRPTDPASFWQQRQPVAASARGPALAAFHAPIEFAFVDADRTDVRVWYATPLGAAEAQLAQQLADEIDRSGMWDKERTAMLGHVPCSDAKAPNNGGDGRLDIYLVYPSTGLDWGGRADSLGYDDDGDAHNGVDIFDGPGDRCPVTSHILLNAQLEFGRLKSAAAHELFHAFQYSFKNTHLPDRGWWMEASATWAKDLVYPEQNFEQSYLVGYWSNAAGPEGPLDSVDGTAAYAAYLLPFYLVQQSGDRTGTVVGRLWQSSESAASIKGVGALPAWTDRFKEFALWNWNRAPANKYVDHGAPIPTGKLSQRTVCLDSHVVAGGDCVLSLGTTNVFLDAGPTSVQYLEGIPDQPVVQLVKFDLTGVRDITGLGLQAILTIGGGGTVKVEDWTGLSERRFCLNREDLRKLVLVVSNSKVEAGQNANGTVKIEGLAEGCTLGHYSINVTNVGEGNRPAPGLFEGDGRIGCTVGGSRGWSASAVFYVDDLVNPAHDILGFDISTTPGESTVSVTQTTELQNTEGPGWFVSWNRAPYHPNFTFSIDDKGGTDVTVHAIATDDGQRIEIVALCSIVARA